MKKEQIGETVEKIALEVIKSREAIAELATKKEFAEFKDENFNRLDKMVTILQRLDQERVFTVERIKCLEEDVNNIKVHLALR